MNPSPLESAPTWRRHPYRIFFPLGALLAWAGVLHWLLHATGLLEDYQPVVHAIVQIQGFMMCFATGFLLTMIPRRTETEAPHTWQMVVALTAPVATTVAAWFERWALSQVLWLTVIAVLIVFAVQRFGRSAGNPSPHSFIWMPLALVIGLAGSLLISGPAFLGQKYFWLHDLGRALLLQGMFVALIVGVGGLAIPRMTRGEGPAEARTPARSRALRLFNLTAAVLLVATFWAEIRWSQRWGLAARSALTLIMLLAAARIWRRPSLPGLHRYFIWISAWMIPLGYSIAAAFPLQIKAGLHVVFIGGFAMMAFSIGLHVTLAHSGGQHLVSGRPWQVVAFGVCFMAAIALRALVDFDPSRFFVWLGASAVLFLAGTIFWAALLLPRFSLRP
jgi:uncharacterized protein involved in response to NO